MPVPRALSTSQLRDDARAAADRVAGDRGLTVRELGDPAEHRVVEHLFSRVWNSSAQAPPPVSADIMRMLSYTGSYVAGAYVGGRLVGAAVGFLTDDHPEIGATHLHSHIAGVSPAERGRQVGFALKLHQRAWALERGFDRITWTFDPLVRRNAYFNLSKLRAGAARYLVDFYGDMHDGINAGQGSDRLLVEWRLDAPDVAAAARGIRPEPDSRFGTAAARPLLRCGDGDAPQVVGLPGPLAATCDVPNDIEALRQADPELARAWRRAVRLVLSTAMSDGIQIAGFDRLAGYVLLDGTEPPT
jgi:predicted GNAT superfamily acetyltransferase